jgi:hypothetical protein
MFRCEASKIFRPSLLLSRIMLGKSYDNLAKTSAKKQGENLDDFSLQYIGRKKRMSGVFADL